MAKNNIVLISEYSMPKKRFKCIWEKGLSVSCNPNKENNKIKQEKLYICKSKYSNDYKVNRGIFL